MGGSNTLRYLQVLIVYRFIVDSSRMTNKILLYFIFSLGVPYFLENYNEAASVVSHVGNGGENLSVLCETICSRPEGKLTFDKEKFDCLCTVANSTDESEDLLNIPVNVDANSLAPVENKTLCKRDTTETIKKDTNTPLPNHQEKKPEIQTGKSKTKKVMLTNTSIKDNSPSKQTPILTTKGPDMHKEVNIESKSKHVNNIDLIPSKTHNEMESKITSQDNVGVKRIAKDNSKQLSEIEGNPTETTIGHLKPLKSLKKSKSSDTIIGDASPKNKLLKTITSSKKSATNSCKSPFITNQLQNVNERVSKLMKETKLPNFNCALLNKEIDSIKAILQVIYKGPDTKPRELDREKLLEQIREKEKERHARIQSRLGNLDLTKHKINIVGRIRTTEKTPVSDEKTKLSDITNKDMPDPESTR